ncbi:hypothetical protein TBK1r_35170 [Stieleria magnilauensis]|uniref:Uncharacterized protein n=1 Tax=Stieleria magnilauensis TaxID=2527963 RepID=A0ABX5XRV3_9BACT|nr:hypothetical protein TBK1r_35170 [Planctomycetes bacterium TBK1r]
MANPPKLADALSGTRLTFDHGSILFTAKRDKGRIRIEVDLVNSRNIRTNVKSDLSALHQSYLNDHPEVLSDGARGSFGPATCCFHVLPMHANEWLRRLFEVVADESNLEPASSIEDMIKRSLGH